MKHLLIKCCIELCLVGLTTTKALHAQSWIQLGTDIDGVMDEDRLGYFVALSADGSRIAIGAIDNTGLTPGRVEVYDWNGTAWVQTGTDIDGEAAGDQFGVSVALSSDGNRLAIGAYFNDGNGNNSGQVRVYNWDGSAWTQVGTDIDGEAANDHTGVSVALSSDGNRLAIAGEENDGNGVNAGHVRVFDWDGSAWVQAGTDIDGEAAGDQFGWSVALSADGNRLAAGAQYNDGNGADSGHVRVYDWDGTAWVQLGTDIDGEAAGDWLGYAVALSANGNRLVAGAPLNDGNGINAGSARVYNWNGATWVQVGADIDGATAGDVFARAVAISADGNRLALGANLNGTSGINAGYVHVYDWNGSAWVQVGMEIEGEASGDRGGWAVALSSDGSRVAIGAPLNDGNGVSSGNARVFEFKPACEANVGTWEN